MPSTSPTHVIIGAGPVGTALARRLTGEGHRVRVVTRSGTAVGDVETAAVDATDHDALTTAAAGAEVLYNCANPGSYPLWEKEWPPLAASILTTAERTGAVLVTMSNLYGYGPVTAPITRATPVNPSEHKGALRARMWDEARAAHEAGRIRATEARASDFIGPTLPISSGLLAMAADATLKGKAGSAFASPDQPHTWTAIDDVAATLAVLGADERAWGTPWIVPSNPARTVREVLQELHAVPGLNAPRLRVIPRWLLRTGGAFVPMLKELTSVLYQFDAPFIADGGETTEMFGLQPTPWSEIIEATAAAWHGRAHARRP